MRNRLVAISQVDITTDGKLATLHLETATAPTFALEVETARLDELIAQLLAVALHAGEASDASPSPQVGSPVNTVTIPTNGAGVTLGPPGKTLLVVRVGCIDLAMEIENQRTRAIGESLVAAGTTLESEPTQAQ